MKKSIVLKLVVSIAWLVFFLIAQPVLASEGVSPDHAVVLAGVRGDEFAVDVLKSREIVEQRSLTKALQSPDYMLGVIDLRRKFGIKKAEAYLTASIVVMDVMVGEEALIIGGVVDSVEEVLELDDSKIESAPRIGTSLNSELIKGMGRLDDQFLIILDIDKVFSTDELTLV